MTKDGLLMKHYFRKDNGPDDTFTVPDSYAPGAYPVPAEVVALAAIAPALSEYKIQVYNLRARENTAERLNISKLNNIAEI